MALRSNFEGLRGKFLHRTPLLNFDLFVHEFFEEETRLKYQFDKGSKTSICCFFISYHVLKLQTRL